MVSKGKDGEAPDRQNGKGGTNVDLVFCWTGGWRQYFEGDLNDTESWPDVRRVTFEGPRPRSHH